MQPLLKQFLAYLEVEKGLAKNTLLSYSSDLKFFMEFLQKLDILSPTAIEQSHISKWCEYRSKENISFSSIHRSVCAIRRFLKFLLKERYLVKYNFFCSIESFSMEYLSITRGIFDA